MLTVWSGSDFRQRIGIVFHTVCKDSFPHIHLSGGCHGRSWLVTAVY